MDKPQEKSSQAKGAGGDGNPMAMGMAMAKKMMGQMGPGGGPMEMMQKMMAQMSESGKPPSMDKMMGMCMGMCGEMLSTIKQTNALAVQATPELQKVFGEWLKRLEDEALGLLAKETADAAALASSLKISEESALYLLNRLAASGKITLTGKVKANGDGS
jgi:hypothetical protein